MTLNQLIALFQAIGTAHYFIKTTEFGEVPDKTEATTETTLYPAFYQVPTNTVTRDNVVERSFSFIVCDLVFPDHSNLNEILSDTEQTLNDIIKILRQESDDYTLINDPQLVPFKDGFGDAVAGWYVDIVIQTINNNAYCDIPAIDFGYPGGGGSSGIPSGGFKCSDLDICPHIIYIDETLISLQEQIDNLPPSALTLEQVLGYGNSTGNISITAATNLSNILQISDTVMGLSWNGTIGGNLTLDNTGTYLYSDTSVYIESQSDVNITAPILYNQSGTGYEIYGSDTGVYMTLDQQSNTNIEINNSNIQLTHLTGNINITSNSFEFTPVGAAQGTIYSDITEAFLGLDTTMYIDITSAKAEIKHSTLINLTSPSITVSQDPVNPLEVATKQYVDNATPTAPTLSSVLAQGNVMNTGQLITAQDTLTYFTLDAGFYLEFSDTNSSNIYMYDTSLDLYHSSNIKLDADNNTFIINGTTNFITATSGAFIVTSTDNAQLYVKSPTGFYYPGIVFQNNGGTTVGSITGYAGVLYTSPLNVSGTIDMNSHKILQVANGTNPSDAVNYSQLTGLSSVYVPYTGATQDVDLGAWALNAASVKINGTNGNGHIHFKHQASDAPSQANSTTLFADVNGDIKYKNDSLYYTTIKTSLNTADRIYTFQNNSGTVAFLSDLTTFATRSITSITTATTTIIPLGINNINYSVTALASALTIQTSGVGGNFDKITIRIKDNGVARALTFDPTYFEAKGQALPTTTVLGKVITIGFIFDSITGKMGCVSVAQEI